MKTRNNTTDHNPRHSAGQRGIKSDIKLLRKNTLTVSLGYYLPTSQPISSDLIANDHLSKIIVFPSLYFNVLHPPCHSLEGGGGIRAVSHSLQGLFHTPLNPVSLCIDQTLLTGLHHSHMDKLHGYQTI